MFGSRLEGEIAKGLLEANGIRSILLADDLNGVRPDLAFSMGVRLLVSEKEEEKAGMLLKISAENDNEKQIQGY